MNLCVRQLSKAFSSQWALQNVDFELHPGDCVALLGQNGAGKTTLLKTIATLIYPTSGAIEIDGVDLRRAPATTRALVGYFSPGGHFYEHLTPKENLQLFLALYNQKKNAAELDEALDGVGLLRWRDEWVSSLSAGMKCRLLLAKWILLEPTFLLLDEPYGPLDGSGVDLLESFVSAQTQKRRAIIMATHQIPRASTLCSRALVLNQGRLVFDGRFQEATEKLGNLMGTLLPRGQP